MFKQHCVCAALLMLGLALPYRSASAADSILMADSTAVVQALQASFDQHNIQLTEQAGTRRFDLIYARLEGGASVISATVRSLPTEPARTRLTILTDSPRDIGLEQQLIHAVAQLLAAAQ